MPAGAAARTPLVCTPGKPNLFYPLNSLNVTCPSCDLAGRIATAAKQHAPPHFVTVYDGLHAFGKYGGQKLEFWTLLKNTILSLGDGFVAIGASEMARLAREALNASVA